MFLTVKVDNSFLSSNSTVDITSLLNSLPYAANDGDALTRGIAIGGYYKASGPISAAASQAAGGTLEPNTLGLKEGTVTRNMGYI